MASIINEAHGKLQQKIFGWQQNEYVTEIATSPLVGKSWRALILLNRAISNKTRYYKDPQAVDPAKKVPNTLNGSLVMERRHQRIRANFKDYGLKSKPEPIFHNSILIVNPHPEEEGAPYRAVTIQGMPSELEVDPESTWATVKSNGRNNPLYFYSGSEDTISFDISWYSNEIDRKDVITKCRLLESWSKANGYKSAPPELWIQWGSSDLFQDESFILWSAPYVLSNFQNSYLDPETKEQVDLGFIPCAATQKLTFKKVTSRNYTYEDIQRVP